MDVPESERRPCDSISGTMVCQRFAGHPGNHRHNSAYWAEVTDEDPKACFSMYGTLGCRLLAGHAGDHQHGNTYWGDPPLPLLERCPYHRPGYDYRCDLRRGHEGPHRMNSIAWPNEEEAVPDGLLTAAEHRAMELTAELATLVLKEVIVNGPTNGQDASEFATHIHVIQRTIMGQAAARAYPDLYRVLGGALP